MVDLPKSVPRSCNAQRKLSGSISQVPPFFRLDSTGQTLRPQEDNIKYVQFNTTNCEQLTIDCIYIYMNIITIHHFLLISQDGTNPKGAKTSCISGRNLRASSCLSTLPFILGHYVAPLFQLCHPTPFHKTTFPAFWLSWLDQTLYARTWLSRICTKKHRKCTVYRSTILQPDAKESLVLGPLQLPSFSSECSELGDEIVQRNFSDLVT